MKIDSNISLTTDIQQLISSDVAWRYSIIPFQKDNNTVTFICSKRDRLNEIKETSLMARAIMTDKRMVNLLEIFHCEKAVGLSSQFIFKDLKENNTLSFQIHRQIGLRILVCIILSQHWISMNL